MFFNFLFIESYAIIEKSIKIHMNIKMIITVSPFCSKYMELSW